YCHPRHPAHHLFPTRRSSDLRSSSQSLRRARHTALRPPRRAAGMSRRLQSVTAPSWLLSSSLHHANADNGIRRRAGVESSQHVARREIELDHVRGYVIAAPERAVADQIEAGPERRFAGIVGLDQHPRRVQPRDHLSARDEHATIWQHPYVLNETPRPRNDVEVRELEGRANIEPLHVRPERRVEDGAMVGRKIEPEHALV